MASMNDPLILSRSCATCRWFDGDCHCGLPWRDALLSGAILEPDQVMCSKHEHEDIEGAPV